MILTILALPMIYISFLIRLFSSSPVIYHAVRVGKDRKLFNQLKYRTMIPFAPDLRNPDGSTLNTHDDPRVTSIGKILRKLSLDELPQFISVLKGDMSIVGPRPDPPSVIPLYRTQDFLRLSVLPGITGWAVIHGRNEISWECRRDLDLEYVRKRSTALDLKIIMLTIPLALFARGVYSSTRAKEDVL